MTTRILQGDVRDVLPTLAADSIDCIVTSPPYWGLRSYLPDGHDDKHKEIGLEPTLDGYLETMVGVCRELRRVLKPEGTFWLNIGSSYFGGGRGGNPPNLPHQKQKTNAGSLTVSGGKRPSQSLQPSHVPAYDRGGKEPSGSPDLDSSCPDLCDEYLDAPSSRSVHSRQPLDEFFSRGGTIGQDSALLDLELRAELSRLSPLSP